jgi:hypothetical protein
LYEYITLDDIPTQNFIPLLTQTTTDSNTDGVDSYDNHYFAYTLPADTLSAVGQRLDFSFTFQFTVTAHDPKIHLYFGGNDLFDTGFVAISSDSSVWVIEGSIWRKSSSKISWIVKRTSPSTSKIMAYSDLNIIDFTDANEIYCSSETDDGLADAGDINGTFGSITWVNNV